MALGVEERKAKVIEDLATRIGERLGGDRSELSQRFVRQLYERVAPMDLLKQSADDLYGAALSLLQFGERRALRETLVRVCNPRLPTEGWHSAHTIVEIATDDMPFLVDSVTAYLNRTQAEVRLVIHPILQVSRDAEGELTVLHPELDGQPDSLRESFMLVQVAAQPAEFHDQIAAGLRNVLNDVRAAVEDFDAMRAAVDVQLADFGHATKFAAPEVIEEASAFLRWLQDDNFTFLGYREYVFADGCATAAVETGLGVLRAGMAHVFDGLITGGRIPAELQRPDLVRVTKGNHRSTVHRPVLVDTIGVKRFDAAGKVVGERLFIGLFTSASYQVSPSSIPLLRRKLARVIERADLLDQSHDFKSLGHILETYPRDELFQIGENELHDISLGILRLQERQRIALFARIDPFERFASCLVYAPRDRYDTALRLRFQGILSQAFDGEVKAFYTHVTDSALARLHFIVQTTPGKVPKIDFASLESALREAGRSWSDRLRDLLVEHNGEERGLGVARRYALAFPSSYQDAYSESTAASDVELVEQALESGDLAMNLYRPLEAREDEVCFKTYSFGEAKPLSDVLPLLENMGLVVQTELPFRLRLPDPAVKVWIRDFGLSSSDGSPIDVAAVRDVFHEAVALAWRGESEHDGFNRLVLRAGLTARQIVVLRAYSRFLRQARVPFSQEYMERTLARNAPLARLLVELFEAKFDPAGEEGRDARTSELKASIEAGLEQVSNLDEDRIVRRFLELIVATLRTSYFLRDEAGKQLAYHAVKLDSQRIVALPLPKPLREIFVYSPRVEAVHLRGGLVARGGIRFSDRPEDFRTEVLGLMKAQMVKNAVIVPVGSKGGFVVKRAPEGDRAALREEVVACYRIMMTALLALTDNLVDGEVVPPANVVRYDDDDPYLVVAADKGTATFSDTANEISVAHGFWLGDAFASGGSAGYDHKAMGITARGAWESVKRHFREVGKDIQSADFTCVGVGDMAGDVFGNGMLLSRHTRLVAAFNHIHIFIDPDPDPTVSFAERKRLFELAGSTWADYDRAKISTGGGVFERSAKKIELTDEMRTLLGLQRETASPAELIQAMLRADVELLWLGGIGTYVRGSQQTDAEVGDRANDALRITGAELCAKVVGEGANLGMTQRARIQYALKGGRLNTDSIDNSAGVDCSDHEVNLKILLGAAERRGVLTRVQRDELLRDMTDEVGELVLRDTYLQSQCITVSAALGPRLLDRFGRFMRELVKSERLNRVIEFLPDDEALAQRFQDGRGLTRPELSILLSYAKMVLYEELLCSDLPDDADCVECDLVEYFPQRVRSEFPELIRGHQLRREIVATVITNELVNRVGITFVQEVREKTGMSAESIARAYLLARETFGMRDLWAQIEALDNQIEAYTQAQMLVACGRMLERTSVWFLRHGTLRLGPSAAMEHYSAGVKELTDQLGTVLLGSQRAAFEERVTKFKEAGVAPDLARRVASLPELVPACDIVRIAEEASVDLKTAARTYCVVGDRFGFDWLRHTAAQLPSDTAWQKLALSGLVDDLSSHQGVLVRRVLAEVPIGIDPDEGVERWISARRPAVARSEKLISELQSSVHSDLAMLAVASRQLEGLGA